MYKPLYIRGHPESTSQVREEGGGISPKGTKYSNLYSNNDIIGEDKGTSPDFGGTSFMSDLWVPP